MKVLTSQKSIKSKKMKYSTGLRSSVEDVDNYLNSERALHDENNLVGQLREKYSIDVARYKAPTENDLYFFRGKRVDATKGEGTTQMLQPSSIANKIVEVVKNNRKALKFLKRKIEKKMTRDELLAVYDKAQISKNDRHQKFLKKIKEQKSVVNQQTRKTEEQTEVLQNEYLLRRIDSAGKPKTQSESSRKRSPNNIELTERENKINTGNEQAKRRSQQQDSQQFNSYKSYMEHNPSMTFDSKSDEYLQGITNLKAGPQVISVISRQRPRTSNSSVTGGGGSNTVRAKVHTVSSNLPIHTIFKSEQRETVTSRGADAKGRALCMYDELGMEKVNFHTRGSSLNSAAVGRSSRPTTSNTNKQYQRGVSMSSVPSASGLRANKILYESSEEKLEWINRDLPFYVKAESFSNPSRMQENLRQFRPETEESQLRKESQKAILKYAGQVLGEPYADGLDSTERRLVHNLKKKKLVATNHNFFRVLSGDNKRIKKRAHQNL